MQSLGDQARAWYGILRSLAIYRRPGRQRALRDLYRPFVRPGDLVFDIGAHVGDRARAFADLGARVIAVEPQPRLQPWLRRLAARRSGIEVRGEAVGARAGEAVLAISRATPTVASLSAAWRSRVVRDHPGFRGVRWDEEITVSVVTLDGLIAGYGLPAFCKIDVEGAEAEVLAGLSQPVAALSFEFVAGALDQARACIDRLEALGYRQCNAVAGEGRRFIFVDWLSPAGMAEWLAGGADGLASGDVYARHPAGRSSRRG